MTWHDIRVIEEYYRQWDEQKRASLEIRIITADFLAKLDSSAAGHYQTRPDTIKALAHWPYGEIGIVERYEYWYHVD